jgi:hypothetical protein
MRSKVQIFLFSAVILTVASSAGALEGNFERPLYKNLARLDNCELLGRSCGQPAANHFCRIKGYERAIKFETEHASPTRVLETGSECTGAVCVAFKSIVCFTSARTPGPVGDWPHPID